MPMRAWVWIGLIVGCALGANPAYADWNVRDAGAVGDGATDDTAAFQKALDEAGAAGGGVVQVPAGAYCIRGNLRIPGAVTLQGVFRTPPLPFQGPAESLAGSVLEAWAGRGEPEGEPFIRLAGHTATLSGLIIRYPEWRQSDVPPVAYPPAVLGHGVEDVAVLDCLILNAYEAMRFQNSARMIIRNVFGYPSWRGLYIDACYDISRVENCHFWPFGVHYKPDDPYCKWVNVNGVAFEFARTDWQYVTHTFCFGYGIGYRFSRSKNGSANGSFVGIGADSCRRAVYVEDAQIAGLLITNGEFVGRWSSQDSVGVEIAEDCGPGKVNLSNCAFWGPLDMALWARGAQAQLAVSTSNFCQWDINGTGAPAVRLDAGKAVLQGNIFDDGQLHVLVNEGMGTAILMGNLGEGGFRAENRAGARTQLIGNEQGGFEWTAAMKAHYTVTVGAPGDSPFLRQWYGREKAPEFGEGGTRRWSRGASQFVLPVVPGKTYRVSVELHQPGHAAAPDNGLYLGGERIAALADSPGPLSGSFEAESDTVTLTLRTATWRPMDHEPGSGDVRDLGVSVHRITLVQEGQEGAPCYNANTGEAMP
ncbi:MAG: hypothetical protein KF886_14365 [Candidatus Hydrogenedentes bacterium]|nr:hypothetical protein [Candidatus Hydrogenedentota bacterium]